MRTLGSFKVDLTLQNRHLLFASRDFSQQLAAWNHLASFKVVHLFLGHLHEDVASAYRMGKMVAMVNSYGIIKLTTGRIRGVIVQPLIEMISIGISKVIMSDSKSTG